MILRILVTGAAGFIGSHTCDQLLSAGHSVLGVDDLSTGCLDNLKVALNNPNFTFSKTDLTLPGKLMRLSSTYNPDVIIHLAALVSTSQSINEPERNFITNISLTYTVAEAARCNRIKRVVFSSSAAVYGNNTNLPITENTPLVPLTPYGAAKAAAEQILLGHGHTYGFNVRCQRFFNVYGSRQDPVSPYSGVIAIFSRMMKRGEIPTIFGDGMQTRDFISVHDVARANVIAATLPDLKSGIVNICSGKDTCLRDLVAILAKVLNTTNQFKIEPSKHGDIRYSRGDPKLALEQIGFKATIPLDVGLSDLII